MRSEVKDPFDLEGLSTTEQLLNNKTIKKYNNKKTKQQSKNVTFSLSQTSINSLESCWLKLRKDNPKITKTSLIEILISKYLSEVSLEDL